MPYASNTGLNVSNQYGPRFTGGSVGVEKSSDSIQVLKLQFTGTSLNDTFFPKIVLPSGALILRYRLRVDEAFNITGTSPTVIIGGTAPATNGVVLTEAELEAIGSKTPASGGTGTWSTTSSTGTTAAEAITKALGGTSPVVASGVGKATLLIEFVTARRS